MARRQVELSSECPYHVTARSNNRDWFSIPLSKAFGIYANKMSRTIELYEIECHAFVLMANHFHMLVSTPKSNLSVAMRYFMTETSRALARASRRINRIYGARYHWTVLRTSEASAHAYFYVYRNPVKHGAVERVEDYKWSTLSPYHHKFRRLLAVKENGFDKYIPTNIRKFRKRLNGKWDASYEESVTKALKRHQFGFHRDSRSGRSTIMMTVCVAKIRLAPFRVRRHLLKITSEMLFFVF